MGGYMYAPSSAQQSVLLPKMERRMVAFRGMDGLLRVRHAVKLSIVNKRSHKIWWLRFFVVLLHRISKSPVRLGLSRSHIRRGSMYSIKSVVERVGDARHESGQTSFDE